MLKLRNIMLKRSTFYSLVATAALSMNLLSCGGHSSNSSEDTENGTTNGVPRAIVSDTINGHGVADIGLSVRWATENVGGDSTYYGWGEIQTKREFTKFNSAWGYKSLKSNGVVEGSELVAKYDAATQNWGQPWRMPTKQEIRELINNCKWEVDTVDSICGYRVTGPNGNSIFLAADGYRTGANVKDANVVGRYWSATHGSGTSSQSLEFNLQNTTVTETDELRIFGQSIRAVTK